MSNFEKQQSQQVAGAGKKAEGSADSTTNRQNELEVTPNPPQPSTEYEKASSKLMNSLDQSIQAGLWVGAMNAVDMT